MRVRTRWVPAVAAITAASALLLHRCHQSTEAVEANDRDRSSGNQQAGHMSEQVPEPSGNVADADRKRKARWEPSEAEVKIWHATEAVFHGKVVDLEGSPVPKAEVVCTIEYYPGAEIPRKIVMQAGDDGTFFIRAQNAPTFQVNVSAAGYSSTIGSHGSYDFAGPPASTPAEYLKRRLPKTVTSRDTPALLTLRKIATREPLLLRHKNEALPEQMSMLIGTDPIHSIQVRYWFDPVAKRLVDQTVAVYSWGVEISVDGGGILHTAHADETAPESFIAPEAGYMPSVRFEYDGTVEEPNIRSGWSGTFFIKFNDGTYARIRSNFDSDPERPRCIIDSWFNPSGSRSTESNPDLNNKIEPSR